MLVALADIFANTRLMFPQFRLADLQVFLHERLSFIPPDSAPRGLRNDRSSARLPKSSSSICHAGAAVSAVTSNPLSHLATPTE